MSLLVPQAKSLNFGALKDEGHQGIEELRALASLLSRETDPRSRQVILAEAAQKLFDLEMVLKAGSKEKKAS